MPTRIENVFSQLPQVTTDRLLLRRIRQSDGDVHVVGAAHLA